MTYMDISASQSGIGRRGLMLNNHDSKLSCGSLSGSAYQHTTVDGADDWLNP